ncbi:uncharacterized protein Nmag_0586 [Natrialba magadii ATCC 43099]|uniref:DUF7974 domain-containing protein n=1 Tax=Natrialba magadii (strain ATCC 43099 / DSM 3394 / CCM 3739 / CIP 104546 / IAM 13178 / JCM 8861 / NBRC 102185 / NCIMB 2190 / MS3) TaxID=547559 RepID=D3SYR2_NATMM|nr:hypothetical protein [Natrialba magadii]ADD04173.1 uncharacterized protein Nmag_0586 [Natrialba magadii ATCC 43099]ELY32958.1 hypothetical protein C500_03339 [Natrialba magadii ATCC 43099]
MRRIYESDAIERDDEPFTPHERESSTTVQSFRSVNSSTLSKLFVPTGLRQRAISVDIVTPQTTFSAGEPIPFTVTMRNSLPLPVTLSTESPLLWTWDIDGVTEATHVARYDPPDKSGEFNFQRGERKRFRKVWHQLFKVSDSEWEEAATGEHTISVQINVPNAEEKGLTAETTVHISPDE